MSYAYKVARPEYFQNIRLAAEENYRGLTAIVDDKPYLVVDLEKVEYVLEGEDGSKIWVEHFDHTARNEHDALIAATRVHEPFVPGTKIGDWTIGNLAYHEGNWHVRNGDTDQIVPIEDLVQMLEDESYFKDNFNSNFNVQLSSAEKRAQRTAALQKVAVTIETNLPQNGWHNGCWHWAQEAGLDGTITYPDGSTVALADPKNFMLTMKNGMMAPGGMNSVPITVETENPDLFWEIWGDTKNRGGGGGVAERTASYTYELPDTPGEHFLDTMEVVADRRDYEHWNEDADYMWWNEEGKHDLEPDYEERSGSPFDDMLSEAADEGYMAASDTPPDALDVPYREPEAIKAFIEAYQEGRRDAGLDLLTPEEVAAFSVPLEPATNYPTYGSWVRESELIQDIPYTPTGEEVVHAYPDGDVVLYDGRTTFDPNKAYGWLLGQKEFDKAEQVKQLIDRSPPSELPAAVIPPDEAQQPQALPASARGKEGR